MQKYFFVLLSLVFFTAGCGLKITEKVNENVLLGKWKMNRISCKADENSTTELELYEIDSIATIYLTLEDDRVNYTSTGACSTSSAGFYTTNFNGTSTGILDFIDILTGGVTCTETVIDSGNNSVGPTVIPTTLVDINGKNIAWLVTNAKDVMELDFFTDFKGSADGDACNATCVCKGYLTKEIN